MDLDEIKAQFDRIFAARGRGSSREQAALLREALIEFKVSIGEIREALGRSEAELAGARREVEDCERRGRLAAEIGDTETASLADVYSAKARARVDLLERKVLVQRDELAMAEEEFETTRARFRAAAQGLPPDASAPPEGQDAPAAPDDDPFLDQRAREAAVEAQLQLLKKKLGERR